MPSSPPRGVAVADLVADPALGLLVATPGGGLDRVVTAAHVTELLRPGPWLQGGELLMTIGLLLPMTARDCAAYVADAAAGGVAALAIGLGRDLPHQEAPGPLVEAARDLGVPLLAVPDRTPFIAVTKAVFAALGRRDREDVERSLELDRRLTSAAAAGGGVDGLLDVWVEEQGHSAAVVDVAGRRIGRARGGGELPEADAQLLDGVRRAGLRAAAALTSPDGRLELHPLGAQRLRGVLLVRPGADRRSTSTLRALLTLELERRHLAGAERRRARAEAVGELFDPATPPGRARHLLELAGLVAAPPGTTGDVRVDGPSVRAVVVEAASARHAAAVATDLALALRGGLVRARGDLVEVVAAGRVDVRALLAAYAPQRPAGIGPPGPVEALPASRRDAAGCLPASRRRGEPVESDGVGAVGLLLRLGAPEAVEAFAARVLGPLRAADRHGTLEATLAAWLDAGASLEEAAARLGVHRHTVRGRLDRAEAALGRSLADPHARHEVWLAVQAADARG